MAKPAPEPEPWYADGLRFQCQRSGACCTNHGDYAYVYLTDDDERALADELSVSLTAFRRQHTRTLDGHRILKNETATCRFLDGHRCSVYPGRPIQCRTWPFWKSNLEPGAWQREVVPLCAGAGRGRLYSRAEIEALAAQHDED